MYVLAQVHFAKASNSQSLQEMIRAKSPSRAVRRLRIFTTHMCSPSGILRGAYLNVHKGLMPENIVIKRTLPTSRDARHYAKYKEIAETSNSYDTN